MGTGKTAIARAVSERFGMRYVSTDDLIEKKERTSIPEIFSKKGEGHFRMLEKNVVREVSLMENVVIDAGGGVVIDPENVGNLKKTAIVICLWATPEVILERTKRYSHRPLLNVPDPLAKIKKLLAKRKPFYEKADYRIDTSNMILNAVTDEIENAVKMHDQDMNEKVKEIYDKFSASTKHGQRTYLESIHALVNLAEAKDPYTKRHSIKVSNYAALMAKRLKFTKSEIENLKLAALLHDIGKLGVKEKVLLKNGSLSGDEYEEVKKHCEIGVEIIRPFRFFKDVKLIIKHHHEKYDGSGYPDGLKRKDIPLGSRILAIADSYDAMTSTRVYRRAYSPEEAIKIMKKEGGSKFDYRLLKIFTSCISSEGARPH